MDLELDDEVAVVLGGAKGIGRAIANTLAAEGARVAVADIDPAGQETAAEIEQRYGRRAMSLVLDVTDFDAVGRAGEQIAEQLGPTQHLMFAVGVGSGKFGFPFWNLQPTDWRRVIDVNLIGAVNAAHAFAPAMVERRGGTMVFLSSVAGQIGSQTDPPYSAAKAGLINFAQCAARDLAEYGVRVNVVSPGMVKTALNRSVWQAWNDRQPESKKISYEDWAEDKIRRVAPLGRWQSPQDIADAAVFLASPRAENITGQTINVDGGQVMHD